MIIAILFNTNSGFNIKFIIKMVNIPIKILCILLTSLFFIVKFLLNRADVELIPLYKDGKFLSIKIKYILNGKTYSLTLLDSLLIFI